MKTPNMQKMHEEQLKRLPKVPLWFDFDYVAVFAIALVVGILIGLAV